MTYSACFLFRLKSNTCLGSAGTILESQEETDLAAFFHFLMVSVRADGGKNSLMSDIFFCPVQAQLLSISNYGTERLKVRGQVDVDGENFFLDVITEKSNVTLLQEEAQLLPSCRKHVGCRTRVSMFLYHLTPHLVT